MSEKKTVSIRILSNCRVAGKSLARGEIYNGLDYDDAKFAVSAGRAEYATAKKKAPKPTGAPTGDK